MTWGFLQFSPAFAVLGPVWGPLSAGSRRVFPRAVCRICCRLPGLVVGLWLQLFPPVFAGCLELSGSGFVGSGLFWPVSWPVGCFLGLGEGFIGLGRNNANMGIYSGRLPVGLLGTGAIYPTPTTTESSRPYFTLREFFSDFFSEIFLVEFFGEFFRMIFVVKFE